jgi:regulatory protein
MNNITAIKEQLKNKSRVSIFIADEYAFSLTKFTAAWLKIGQELTEQEIADLKSRDENEVLLQKAINFISYRPRSEQETRYRLRKYGCDQEQEENIIARLRSTHLLDDNNFAEIWVENRSDFRPRSKYALRIELYKKGISNEIIDDVLEKIDDLDLATRAAKQQARKYQMLEWKDFKKKLNAFLSRRGFSYSVIQGLAKNIWDEINSPTYQ